MLDWLDIARNQAEERFRSLPFPGKKDENYQFTPLEYREAVEEESAAASTVAAEITAKQESELALLKVDGEEASSEGEANGCLFTDMLRAAVLGSDSLRARLKDADLFRDDKFAQLTSARWKNGAFLHVPAGVKRQRPLRFLNVASAAEEHFRNLIQLEEGAEAILVQESWSDTASRFVGELTEVRLGRNSRLHWIVLQQFGHETSAAIRQRIDLAEGAELRYTPLFVGGKTIQTRQEARLGAHSLLETQGAARGELAQHFDFWLDLRHEGERSRSSIDYSFVIAGRSRGVFNSQIEVAREAKDCESSQRSKSLLLGTGTVHAIPRLIIKTDEVKAAHGASVSSINPEQMHYLQSRGIPAAEAEKMIVRGVTEVVVSRFPTEDLQNRAEALLDAKQGGSP